MVAKESGNTSQAAGGRRTVPTSVSFPPAVLERIKNLVAIGLYRNVSDFIVSAARERLREPERKAS